MDDQVKFDDDELMHLALHSIRNEATPDKAIAHLKQLIKMQPKNGKAYYLLGALHAEIGMFDQAIEEMAHALILDPDLTTAQFQLGLLYLTSGNTESAENTWRRLDDLGENNPLFLFKKGMLHLVKDEFDSCVEALKAGIECNRSNEDLNHDMRRVLQDAERAKMMKSNIPCDDNEAKTGNSKEMLLSFYEAQDAD